MEGGSDNEGRGVSAAKQTPRRPGTAPALGLRADSCRFLVSQAGSPLEVESCFSPTHCGR